MTRSRVRVGFTLIELLVVIAIISILAALVSMAVFRTSTSQQGKRSETTLRTLASAFDQQWQAVIDDAKMEAKQGKLPAGDPRTAMVTFLESKLTAEFPQTAGEVVANSYFAKAFSASGTAAQQNAALLYLTLTKGRRGMSFNPDDVKTATIGTMKYFIDDWGNPIQFQRWPTGSELYASELNAPPYAPAGRPSIDPLDPEGMKATKTQNRSPVLWSWGPDKVSGTADDLLSFRVRREGAKGN